MPHIYLGDIDFPFDAKRNAHRGLQVRLAAKAPHVPGYRETKCIVINKMYSN